MVTAIAFNREVRRSDNLSINNSVLFFYSKEGRDTLYIFVCV